MSDNERCGHGACVRPKGHTGSHSVALKGTPFSVPQGEDHEALDPYRPFPSLNDADAIQQIERAGRVSPSRDGTVAGVQDDATFWRCTDCNCANREDEPFCFRCGAGQPEFPARVGSVAVEDVEKLLSALRRIAYGLEGEMGRYDTPRDDTWWGRIALEALAEFSRSSTDRPEQPEPDVLGGQPPAEPETTGGTSDA